MILYIIQACTLGIVSLVLLIYYSHTSTPYYVRFLVFLSFFVCMVGFMTLPIDIYQNSVEDSQNLQSIAAGWLIIYYINFFTCWLILPLAQEYEESGNFSFIGKMKDALKMNGILIGLLILGAFIIVIVWLISGTFTADQIPSAFAMLVNVFGLLLVSIFMGFGLVSFPKECFYKRDCKRRVDRCHRDAEARKAEAQVILEEIYDIRNVLNKKTQQIGSQSSQLYQLLKLLKSSFSLSNFKSYVDPNAKLQNSTLPQLHKIIKKRNLQFQACECQLDDLVDELKSVTESYSNNNYSRKHIFYTVLFGVSLLITIIIFLAEVATFLPFLRPINLLQLVPWSSPASYFMNCLLMAYIVYIVTHTIFRIKIYKVFALHKNHSTAASLLFTSINLCRICYPLCYNYLQITGLNLQQNSTSFQAFFGQVNFPNQFSIAFPILMVVFGLFNLFDVYDTIIGCLGMGSYAFDAQEQIQKKEEGKNILIERLRQRNIQNNTLEMMQLL